MTKITAQYFEEATGRAPAQDDLERCNCKDAGHAGHWYCGWCEQCDCPQFLCECIGLGKKPDELYEFNNYFTNPRANPAFLSNGGEAMLFARMQSELIPGISSVHERFQHESLTENSLVHIKVALAQVLHSFVLDMVNGYYLIENPKYHGDPWNIHGWLVVRQEKYNPSSVQILCGRTHEE
jgi:hypothetical protein